METCICWSFSNQVLVALDLEQEDPHLIWVPQFTSVTLGIFHTVSVFSFVKWG